jgi:hypothetical protein
LKDVAVKPVGRFVERSADAESVFASVPDGTGLTVVGAGTACGRLALADTGSASNADRAAGSADLALSEDEDEVEPLADLAFVSVAVSCRLSSVFVEDDFVFLESTRAVSLTAWLSVADDFATAPAASLPFSVAWLKRKVDRPELELADEAKVVSEDLPATSFSSVSADSIA